MIAKLISAITSPPIILTGFGLWVIYVYSNNIYGFVVFGLYFLILGVAPALVYILIGMSDGEIGDFHIAIREQREKPFLVAIFGTLLLCIIYYLVNAPSQLTALVIVMLVNGIVFYLVTRYWKVSIHAAAFLGSVIIVAVFIDKQLLYLSLLLPFIIWARLRRHKHNLWQALASSIIVGATTSLTLYIMHIM